MTTSADSNATAPAQPAAPTRGSRLLRLVLGAMALAVLLFVLGPRTRVDEPTIVPSADGLRIPTDPGEIEGWLARSEDSVPDVFEHARKHIVWADPTTPGRTETVVVYLHGFSATRQEVAPLPDSLAARLGANLYYPRFAGHGRPGTALADLTPDAWARDVSEAMAIAERLGERVILVGTSTGGTLAMWAATRGEWTEPLEAVVLLSPNFAVQAGAAWVFGMPWGGWIAEKIAGEERSWEPANPLQGRYWTTTYPLRALVPMMAWVRHVARLDLGDVRTPVWIGYSPNDQVVSPEAIEAAFEGLGSPRKEAVRFDESGDPSNHILAGDVLSPSMTIPIVELIEEFVRDTLAAEPD